MKKKGLIIIVALVALAAAFFIYRAWPTSAPSADETNENGVVTLKVGKRAITVEIVDEVTGKPLPFVAVSIGTHPEQPGAALLMVADPYEQYPLQMIVLEGKGSLFADGTFVESAFAFAPLSIPVRSEEETMGIIKVVETSRLKKISLDVPIDYSLLLPPTLGPLAKLPYVSDVFKGETEVSMEVKKVDAIDMPKQIVQDFQEGVSPRAIAEGQYTSWMTSSLISEGVGFIPPMFGTFTNAVSEIVFTEMGATSYEIYSMRLGPFTYKFYKPIFADGPPKNPFPERPLLDVSVVDDEGKPVPEGSLELISPDTIGKGFVGVLDTQGQANIPVPIGQYEMTVRSPGNLTKKTNVPVREGKNEVRVAVEPFKLARLILMTIPPLTPTGFLEPGTQIQFTVLGEDTEGNLLSPSHMRALNCVYIHRNPVGSKVASIHRKSGLMTVGEGDGAMRLLARCNGVTSNLVLVSSKEEEEEPKGEPLPEGFPTLPRGNYEITGEVCVSVGGCISMGVVDRVNRADAHKIVKELVPALNEVISQTNALAPAGCRASLSYSPFVDDSFTATITIVCRSGESPPITSTTVFRIRKI